MKYKVVLVPFPFDDLTTNKVRPAVCLTEAIGQYRHVVLAFITSQKPKILENSDLIVEEGEKEFTMTGLRVSSTLRLHRLLTLPTRMIRRELGILSPRLRKKVNLILSELFCFE